MRLRMLAELAELGLELARDLQACARASEDPDQKNRLSDGFHKTCRGVRHSLALHARCEREEREADREREAEVIEQDKVRRRRRKAEIAAEVTRLIWTETEHDEDEKGRMALELELEEILSLDAACDGFPDQPIEAQIQRIAKALGLTAQLLSPLRSGAGGPPADPGVPRAEERGVEGASPAHSASTAFHDPYRFPS